MGESQERREQLLEVRETLAQERLSKRGEKLKSSRDGTGTVRVWLVRPGEDIDEEVNDLNRVEKKQRECLREWNELLVECLERQREVEEREVGEVEGERRGEQLGSHCALRLLRMASE